MAPPRPSATGSGRQQSGQQSQRTGNQPHHNRQPTQPLQTEVDPGMLYRPQDKDASKVNQPVVLRENKFFEPEQKVSLESNIDALSLGSKLASRPGYGTRGEQVLLWTNYMTVNAQAGAVLHCYNIKVTPEVTGGKLRQVVRLLLQHASLDQFRENIATDLQTHLISCVELPEHLAQIGVVYREDKEDPPTAVSATHTVSLAFRTTHQMSNVIERFEAPGDSLPDLEKDDVVQCLNILIGNYAKTGNANARALRSKVYSLNPTAPRESLGFGLHAKRGFFFSVRPATGRFLVNVNVTHGVFYDKGPLRALLDKRWELMSNFQSVESFLKRLKITTNHLSERKNSAGEVIPRVHTITGLANQQDGKGLKNGPRVPYLGAGPGEVRFYHQGKRAYITVAKFFADEYNIKVLEDCPVVKYGNATRPMYLPVDVCIVLPGQHTGRKLENDEIETMRNFAARDPVLNAQSITADGPRMIGMVPEVNSQLGRFGITVNPQMITATGKRLPTNGLIEYFSRASPKINNSSWNLMNLKFSRPKILNNWSYLIIYWRDTRFPGPPPRLITCVDSFVKEFKDYMRRLGMTVGNHPKRLDAAIRAEDDPAIAQQMQHTDGNPRLARYLLVFLPSGKDKLARLYNHVKKLGDIELGIHTVCVRAEKIERPKISGTFYTNIAHKMNLKLGGCNQGMANPVLKSFFQQKNIMVMGVDVTHPSPHSRDTAPSVATVAASVNTELGQFPVAVTLQPRAGQEMVGGLVDMVKSRLVLWKTHNQNYPANIIVYRDGVAESQEQTVLDEEVPLIRRACRECYPPGQTPPRITVIIIRKRHHTHFFPIQEKDSDARGNPKNGLVVDRSITKARKWDFFIVPHEAIQGTVKPAHCIVIVDEIICEYVKGKTIPGYTNAADMLHDLTHTLCYLFQRSTRAVSLCPPAYYADLACERARCYLARHFDSANDHQNLAPPTHDNVQVHRSLRDTMFYM